MKSLLGVQVCFDAERTRSLCGVNILVSRTGLMPFLPFRFHNLSRLQLSKAAERHSDGAAPPHSTLFPLYSCTDYEFYRDRYRHDTAVPAHTHIVRCVLE